jgi:hypothetical protein
MAKFAACTGALVAMNIAMSACGQSHPQWVEQVGQNAIHVKTPPGWTVESAADAHVMIKSADGSEFVLVQPFQSGSEITATKAIDMLVGHWTKILPNPQISDVKQITESPDQAVAKVQFGENGGSRANVLCYNQRGAGMLYAVAAPASKFTSARQTLVDVLSSFRYGGSAAANPQTTAGSGLSYATWTEPNQQAYTVQVPQGWNVTGGLTQPTPIDLRNEIQATSPDGQIQAQYGEAKMLPFKPLTGTIFQRGFHQGSISEYHGWFMFLDYETGAQFSKGYLSTVLSKKYQDLKIGESKDRPDMDQLLNPLVANLRIQIRISVGQTEFTYTDNGQPRSGIIFATTVFSAPGTVSQGWTAVPGICTAPPDKLPTALEVLAHLALPKWSAEWAAKVNANAAAYTSVIQATAQNDKALSDHIYNNFVNTLHESGRQMENTLTGTTDVRDANGTAYHVAVGHNYYYLNAGQVVGSNSPYPPDIGFTPLTQF